MYIPWGCVLISLIFERKVYIIIISIIIPHPVLSKCFQCKYSYKTVEVNGLITVAWLETGKWYQNMIKVGSNLSLMNLSLTEGRVTRTEEITWVWSVTIKVLLLKYNCLQSSAQFIVKICVARFETLWHSIPCILAVILI